MKTALPASDSSKTPSAALPQVAETRPKVVPESYLRLSATQAEVLGALARPGHELYELAGSTFVRRCIKPETADSYGEYRFVLAVRRPTSDRLEAFGLIERVGPGRYAITAVGRAAVAP